MKTAKLLREEKCGCCGRRDVRHVAVDAVCVKDGRIVLVKRSKRPGKGMWALPGGMLDWDESADEGVVRELREETGLTGKIGRFVGVFSEPERCPFQRVAIVFEVIEIGGKIKADDDALDAKWFDLDNLPELAVDHGKMIKEYRNRIMNHEL